MLRKGIWDMYMVSTSYLPMKLITENIWKNRICNILYFVELYEVDEDKALEMLNVIEEANANVAQGYKLFKIIKDLRVQKKHKADKLLQIQMLTDYVDCDYMHKTYQYNLEQMEQELKGDKAEIVELEKKLEMVAI